jgi:VWFA-related protein
MTVRRAVTLPLVRVFPALAALALLSIAAGRQAPALKITSPAPDAVISGATRLEVTVTPPDIAATVQTMTFTVDGKLACTITKAPFVCNWDPGDVIRGHHVRVVATFVDIPRLIDNVRTKDLGYAEKVNADAVLVPVIVTDHGEFVRGLTQQDFQLSEDGVPQRLSTLVSENAPLELVLAIDVSGSMEGALPEVKSAVKQLLTKLRPGDAATLLGFNDTWFIVAEREKDPRTREEAVELLSSWGGTALYDATVRTLDLVSHDFGRKGVVIFSDGDDRHSLTPRETAMARVQASDAMLYTVGFGGGATVPGLRSSLETYARSTGGRSFFPRQAKELDGIFDDIVSELANQYVLSYSSTNLKQDNAVRAIKVQVKKGKYEVRARQSYRLNMSSRTGR